MSDYVPYQTLTAAELNASVNALATALTAASAALTASVGSEATARVAGDAAEAALRVAGVAAEATLRVTGDAAEAALRAAAIAARAFSVTIPAALASLTSNIYSSAHIFDGDNTKTSLSVLQTISGATTLGSPSTGYLVHPEYYPVVGYVYNSSGWMANNATGDGQTGIGFAYINGEHHGQGNMCMLQVYGQSYGSNPAATGFLAYPSIGLFGGQVTSGATGTYLNPVEVHTNDNGFDSAAINYVAGQFRNNLTGANGANWVGYLSTNQGAVFSDTAFLATGSYRTGLDLSPVVALNQAHIVVPADGRIYMNAINTGYYSTGTALGTAYLTCFAGALVLNNGGTILAVNASNVSTNAAILPAADNAYTLGAGTNRWSSVWAANGTIQTSDPALKTDIAPLPPALPIVAAINPVTFKWKTGGKQAVTSTAPGLVHATETVTDHKTEVEIVDGVPTHVTTPVTHERLLYDQVGVVDDKGQPVMIDVGGKKGPVRLEQKMHPVPRMVQGSVTTTTMQDAPGKRTHWGFLAPEVKAAFDRTGLDFGGHVVGQDGTSALRPDQLIPVLWRAVQELAAEVASLKAPSGNHPNTPVGLQAA